MTENKSTNHETGHLIGYGVYVLIWLTLLSLTAITVSIAGINLGSLTLFTALFIAAIKSALVINIFMHIKFSDKMFKFFLLVTAVILIAVFVLTGFDIFYR